MKKLLPAVFILFATSQTIAQNLVPNADFEIYGVVPCGWANTAAAFDASTSGWNTPTEATPDIHSTLVPQMCSNHHPFSSYPCNNGSQMPHSGNIFAGFYTYRPGVIWREYLQVELTTPMIPGIVYYVQLYVSLGDQSVNATNNIGVGFSTTSTYVSITGELGYAPQMLFTNVISDTVNWVLLKDTITPAQAYQYIIIGNFFNDAATSIVPVNAGGCSDLSYYYCDDVCISPDSSGCPSFVGINEVKNKADLILFPNPFSDKLTITTNHNSLSEIILYDIASGKLLQQQFTNAVTFNTAQLAKGMYLYEVKNKNGEVKKGKVVKE